MRNGISTVLVIGWALCLLGCDSAKSGANATGTGNVNKEQIQDEVAKAEKARIKASIERVLRQDATTTQGTRSVAEVVARMRAIDTSGCPNDLRAAYLAHIHAWELMGDVEREAIAFKAEANSDGVMIESFIRGLLGDPLGKATELKSAETYLQRRYQAADLQVKQTFHRVEELAILHGGRLPE